MAKLTRSLCEKTLITKQDDKDYHSGNAGALTCLFEQDAIKALPLWLSTSTIRQTYRLRRHEGLQRSCSLTVINFRTKERTTSLRAVVSFQNLDWTGQRIATNG